MNFSVTQKGVIVTMSRTAGTIFIVLALGILGSIIFSLINLVTQGDITFLGLALVFSVFSAGLCWMGTYWICRFPDICVTDYGLRTVVSFLHNDIEWCDIVDCVETKGLIKHRAILVNPHKRGMLLGRMYGLFEFGNWNKPVVLISQKSRGIDMLISEIEKRRPLPSGFSAEHG